MDNCTTPLKRCTKCGEEKPATPEYFHKDRNRSSGLFFRCKQCCSRRPPKPSIPSGMKRCSRCQNTLPANQQHFARDLSKKDGLFSWCNPCQAAYKKELYAQSTEDVRESKRAFVREWRKRNPDYPKEWRAKNPGKKNQYTERRRTLKQSLPSTFTVEQWENCLGYFDYRCAVCERPAGLWHVLAQDHWIPLSKGGATTADNIIPLCHSKPDGTLGCNNLKHSSLPVEWVESRYGKRRAKQIIERINAYFEWVDSSDSE